MCSDVYYLLLCSRLESDASSMSENNDEDDDDEGGDDGHHQVTSTLRNAQHVPGCQIQSQVSFLKCFFGVPLLATYVSFFLNKPGLGGTGIDPGMTFTSFQSSIG